MSKVKTAPITDPQKGPLNDPKKQNLYNQTEIFSKSVKKAIEVKKKKAR